MQWTRFPRLESNFLKKAFFFADAAYGGGKVIKTLNAQEDILVTRCKSNVTAQLLPETLAIKKRGRPKVYGKKLKFNHLFERKHKSTTIPSHVYGETDVKIRLLAKMPIVALRPTAGQICSSSTPKSWACHFDNERP